MLSSRRRHTRWPRDWSSDVCSSDLKGFAFSPDSPMQKEFEASFPYRETEDQLRCVEEIKKDKIGRASCRERESTGGVAGPAKRRRGDNDEGAAGSVVAE